MTRKCKRPELQPLGLHCQTAESAYPAQNEKRLKNRKKEKNIKKQQQHYLTTEQTEGKTNKQVWLPYSSGYMQARMAVRYGTQVRYVSIFAKKYGTLVRYVFFFVMARVRYVGTVRLFC